MPVQPDPIFGVPRLAAVYDTFDGPRDDLDHYVAIVHELGAASVLDIGCGTGSLACRLGADGIDVVGVDPARASLDVARAKPGAERVRWIEGTVADLPPLDVDLATMTGNVAQVFLGDDEWDGVLEGIHRVLCRGGWLVFETRDPARRAWEEWTPAATYVERQFPGIGQVDHWTEVIDVALPLVTFRQHYRFHADSAQLTSDSTLRFRSRAEVESSLDARDFSVVDVRDAPDRPGRELVVLARARSAR